MTSKIPSFLGELKRRKVFRVAAVYVAVGLGILGAAELILEPLGLDSLRPYIVILVLLGFPIALVMAWVGGELASCLSLGYRDVVDPETGEVREVGLTVPHPGLAQRAFVLRPVGDVMPDLRLPDGC